jgi:hypothetical protein
LSVSAPCLLLQFFVRRVLDGFIGARNREQVKVSGIEANAPARFDRPRKATRQIG